MNDNESNPNRPKNVEFANQQLDAEIAYRNGRKDSQENAARGVVVAAGVVLTLLIGGVATAEGVDTTTPLFRVAFVGTIALALVAGLCGLRCQWPRKYERLGEEALDRLKDPAFLNEPPHEVGGRTLAAKVEIAKTADRLHEDKADWLVWSLRLLLAAFVGLAFLASVVVFQDDTPTTGLRGSKATDHFDGHNYNPRNRWPFDQSPGTRPPGPPPPPRR